MFNNEKIKKLEEEINRLESLVKELEGLILNTRNEGDKRFELINNNSSNFEFKIGDRLDVFHKGIIDRLDTFHKEISDKYIKAIENLVQTTKETMLIDTLIKQVNEKDLDNLKRTLIQPILEERWKEEKEKKVKETEEVLKSRGQKILEMRNDMYQRFLRLDREGKDTTLLKAQLELLDKILEVADVKKNI